MQTFTRCLQRPCKMLRSRCAHGERLRAARWLPGWHLALTGGVADRDAAGGGLRHSHIVEPHSVVRVDPAARPRQHLKKLSPPALRELARWQPPDGPLAVATEAQQLGMESLVTAVVCGQRG